MAEENKFSFSEVSEEQLENVTGGKTRMPIIGCVLYSIKCSCGFTTTSDTEEYAMKKALFHMADNPTAHSILITNDINDERIRI